MTVELRTPGLSIEQAPVYTLSKLLNHKFGSEWIDYENETISLEMGMALTPLLRDKIDMLRILHSIPGIFYDDFMFFMHTVDVINNHVADFEHMPSPNSLEIAWAIHSVAQIVEGQFDFGIKVAVTQILKKEGFSEAPVPLAYACFEDKLVEGQDRQDILDKEEAVRTYIEHMEKGE